jgi:hypothetical protein
MRMDGWIEPRRRSNATQGNEGVRAACHCGRAEAVGPQRRQPLRCSLTARDTLASFVAIFSLCSA